MVPVFSTMNRRCVPSSGEVARTGCERPLAMGVSFTSEALGAPGATAGPVGPVGPVGAVGAAGAGTRAAGVVEVGTALARSTAVSVAASTARTGDARDERTIA
jgi:hypothetical protein